MNNKNRDGFTIIELIVTIAVLAILLGVAVPNFWTFIQSNRVTAQTNGLVTALSFARSEAVKRGDIVSICAADGSQPVSGCGNNWTNGWLVYFNPDGAGGPTAGNMIRVWERMPERLDLTLDTQNAPSQTRLDFNAMGNLELDALGNFRFRWIVQPDDCTAGHPFRRTVDVSNVGRAQVMREECQ